MAVALITGASRGFGRALALDLASLSPGPYRIEVTMSARGRASVTARRNIELVQP